METQALGTLGINKWIAGVRCRMENDPGRKDLDDHIFCNGFLFLDEYLEHILMGAKTEPIIELTKTPGRRKELSKNAKSFRTANLAKPVSPDKENISVTNSATVKKASNPFHKALLKASKENQQTDPEEETTLLYKSVGNPFGSAMQSEAQQDVREERVVEAIVVSRVTSPPHSEVTTPLHLPSVKQSLELPDDNATTHQSDTKFLDHELSIIPEDDEHDKSRAPVLSQQKVPLTLDKEILRMDPRDANDHSGVTRIAVSHEASAHGDDTEAFQNDHSFNDSEPTSTASSFPIDPYARDYDTHELRYMVGIDQPSERARQSPPPANQTLTRETSVPVFPSLPGPSPLHKATHEFSGGGPSIITDARPGAASRPGTRTSWLSKARDVSAKRASVANGLKRKSGGLNGVSTLENLENGSERAKKIAKTSGEVNDIASELQRELLAQSSKPITPAKSHEEQEFVTVVPESNSEGMMDILKRTVEGFGARVGKTMGKSLGGAAAAAAAAEAKAAAEARLAQRVAKGSDEARQSRLSVSDLIGVYDNKKVKVEESLMKSGPTRPVLPSPGAISETSISATQLDPLLPSPSFLSTAAPVTTTHTIPKFTVQRHGTIEPTLLDSQPSTQSTDISSIFDDRPSWALSSQTTEMTASQGLSQPESQVKSVPVIRGYVAPLLSQEAGETWHQWEDSYPQSQIVGRSQERDAIATHNGMVTRDENYGKVLSASERDHKNVVSDDPGRDVGTGEEAMVMTDRPISRASSDTDAKSKEGSSQESTQAGFVAQASGFLSKVMGASVNSALGNSKRGKAEPVKSIQLAAAAAKKQQEEADRKAARLRDMDKRRAAIASKKAEQESVEKVKKQGKRDREEGQEKKITRATSRKVEEDLVKKRKGVMEIERKPEIKKPVSKDKNDFGGSRNGKSGPNSSQTQSVQGTQSKYVKQSRPPAATQPTIKLVSSSQGESTSFSQSTTKEKITFDASEDIRQPSQALHAQMQARVEAQMLATRNDEPIIPSESIELPDINSEYSDSDDENRQRTFDPPGWAQSPDLRLALESQSRMNPDDIFGPVRPLRMEEIFPTRQSRFRARTSSANWAGTDEVTRDEEAQYAKRMGYLD